MTFPNVRVYWLPHGEHEVSIREDEEPCRIKNLPHDIVHAVSPRVAVALVLEMQTSAILREKVAG